MLHTCARQQRQLAYLRWVRGLILSAAATVAHVLQDADALLEAIKACKAAGGKVRRWVRMLRWAGLASSACMWAVWPCVPSTCVG